MNKLFLTLFVAICMGFGSAYAAETKQVCKEVTDKKGKKTEQCKKIKVHKKLEGTEVPDKKK
jgi:hypothetical protein